MRNGRRLTPANPNAEAPVRGSEAYVIFVGETDIWWLNVLKVGFRHCFVVLQKGNQWVVFDPLSHQLLIEVVANEPGVDPKSWYESLGHRVVPCTISPRAPEIAPFAPFTCVEAVKRLLGIHDRKVITPWQLYQHLEE